MVFHFENRIYRVKANMFRKLILAMICVGYIVPMSFICFAVQLGNDVSGLFGGLSVVLLFIVYVVMSTVIVGIAQWFRDRSKPELTVSVGRIFTPEEIEAEVDKYVHRYARVVQ